MRRPNVCPTCSAALGKETRHSAKRYCSQVQAQRRYVASAKGRAANRAAQAASRARKAGSDGTA